MDVVGMSGREIAGNKSGQITLALADGTQKVVVAETVTLQLVRGWVNALPCPLERLQALGLVLVAGSGGS